MAVAVGQKAPDFTLPASDGKAVGKFTLSDAVHKGPVVLAFFPLAFTSVCRDELCEFRDGLDRFSALKAQVVGLSVDSPFALNAFSQAEGLTFPLLSDFNKEITTQYGVLYKDLMGFKGVAQRSVFVVDSGGVVRYRWVSENPKNKPDLGEVAAALEAL